MAKKKIRAVLSSLLLACLLLLAATGAALYFMKTGMIGPFSRKFLTDCHAITALAMLVTAAVHHWLNRKIYKEEMRALFGNKAQKEGPENHEE